MNNLTPPPFVRIEHALIAFDKELQRCYVSKLLQRLGATSLSSASCASEALESLRHERFDLIVTSTSMPGLTVLRLIDELVDVGFGGYVIVSGSSDMRIQDAAQAYLAQRSGNSIRLIFAGEPLRLFDLTEMLHFVGLQPLPQGPVAPLHLAAPPISSREVCRAFRAGDITTAFKPYYCVASAVPLGAEIQLRWRHPVQGPIAWHRLVGVLEKSGLGDELTELLIDSAVRTSVSIRQALPLKLSLKIPGHRISSASWADRLVQRIYKEGGHCAAIAIDVTDDADTCCDARIAGAVAHWRLNGIDCAIDDFGASGSSLYRLCMAPFNVLKIDRHLIARARTTNHVLNILEGIIELAHGLGVRVTAQGIESEEDLKRMRSIKCDAVQGQYFGPLLSEEELISLAVKGATFTRSIPLAV